MADLERLIEDRFDKFDAKIEVLREEAKDTRHAQAASMKQMTEQLVELTIKFGEVNKDVERFHEWKGEGGPLDSRFRRHDKRLIDLEGWRERLAGRAEVLKWATPVICAIVGSVVGAITAAVTAQLLG